MPHDIVYGYSVHFLTISWSIRHCNFGRQRALAIHATLRNKRSRLSPKAAAHLEADVSWECIRLYSQWETFYNTQKCSGIGGNPVSEEVGIELKVDEWNSDETLKHRTLPGYLISMLSERTLKGCSFSRISSILSGPAVRETAPTLPPDLLPSRVLSLGWVDMCSVLKNERERCM